MIKRVSPVVVALLATSAVVDTRVVASSRPVDGRSSGPASTLRPARTDAYGFEPNLGQWDARVRYVGRFREYVAYMTDREIVLEYGRTAPDPQGRPASIASGLDDLASRTHVGTTAMRFPGASPVARVEASETLGAASGYFLGRARERWRAGVPRYARVVYHDLFPGVDARFKIRDGRLEYDFIVRPNGDVRSIEVEHDGAVALAGSSRTELTVSKDSCAKWTHGVAVYQHGTSGPEIRAGRFEARSASVVGFEVSDYDRASELIIDPTVTLAFSTFLGGSSFDFGIGVTADAEGNAYVTGLTLSLDFPSTGTLGQFDRGVFDGFVAKLAPDGRGLVFADYFGGDRVDKGVGIALDAAGRIVVGGITSSANFPLAHSLQPVYGGAFDAFVLTIDPSGTQLLSSTYVGGSAADGLTGVAVDSAGAVVIAGGTASSDFPTLNALYGALAGGRCFDNSCADAFVAKIDPQGSGLVFSTFYGGAGYDVALSIALDPTDAVVVSGYTQSADLPTRAPLQSALRGRGDGFVAKLTSDGRQIVAATYLGGTGDDLANGVDVDAAGVVYVTGNTASSDFPTFGALQPVPGGGDSDAFVAKLDGTLARLVYSTYLGGNGYDVCYGVSVDVTASVYVMGFTSSTDFPAVNAVQATYGGGDNDVFVSKMTPAGDAFVYSTYVGGDKPEQTVSGVGLYVDFSGNAIVTGAAYSQNFPVTDGAFQTRRNGDDSANDGFVFKIVDKYTLTWQPPDPTSTDPAPPPQFLVARRAGALASEPDGPRPSGARAGTPIGYKVYRSSKNGAPPTSADLLTTTGPTQTTTGPNAPGGAFFVVTAIYPGGVESDPSNPASGGSGEPDIVSVTVSGSKLVATGTRFTSHVRVLIDGVPCVKAARVAADGRSVVQKGSLLTSQTLAAYLGSKPATLISLVNETGGIGTYLFTRPARADRGAPATR